LTSILDELVTTATVELAKDPFQKIIGQDQAVSLVRSAVQQRRHVLLCGVPGIGKSMLAKAAFSLLKAPTEEIRLHPDPTQPERPQAIVVKVANIAKRKDKTANPLDESYSRPEDLPFEIAVKMGYRCPKCSGFSNPDYDVCIDCGSGKRSDWSSGNSYRSLFRVLDVIREPALTSVSIEEDIQGVLCQTTYRRTNRSDIMITREPCTSLNQNATDRTEEHDRTLVSWNSTRFVLASGTSPVELLGDVKHDPYGSAETLGTAAHLRVVPGAIHEAHEGILYVDEIAALGHYQKHLLTAMQDRKFPISGHNPHSSGAAVRVDDVPCDFILFASCNIEDLSAILPPLRSRIRGYGYEIMLDSWTDKSTKMIDCMVRFIAQTIDEDGRIPHFTSEAVNTVLRAAEDMAYRLDRRKDAFTLRLREIGGLVRVAGDLAVQESSKIVQKNHVERAEILSRGLEGSSEEILGRGMKQASQTYGDYFF
jgi:predicted ATP-dependent protease